MIMNVLKIYYDYDYDYVSVIPENVWKEMGAPQRLSWQGHKLAWPVQVVS